MGLLMLIFVNILFCKKLIFMCVHTRYLSLMKYYSAAARSFSTECEAVSLSPPTDGGDMVPDGALVFYTDASNVDTNVCGEPCFSETCYKQVPMECCDNADSQFFSMDSFFKEGNTCSGPINVTKDLTVYLAGGCSADGTFFYGEMCGGSNFGAFKELSDGTPLNLGVCNQPETICECNAYVQTKTAGCFTVGTPLGAAEQYFMKVNDPVCKKQGIKSQGFPYKIYEYNIAKNN